MTKPWIIWTTPRTGGTTLYEALQEASPDLRYVEDEPFSCVWPAETWPKEDVEHKLSDLLSGRGYAIKHVLDPFPDEFNIHLAHISTWVGYVHVHLVRRDKLAWLASRGVALQLDAWNPRYSLPLIEDLLAGRRELAPLDVNSLVSYSQKVDRQWEAVRPCLGPTTEVAYEDLYEDNRSHTTASLASFLGIRADFSSRLTTGGQDTSRVWHLIPNLDELRSALTLE